MFRNAYLELLRPANIVTAVADVLAGYAVAGLANAPALPWLVISTASLYGGGVVLNDYCDREIDRVERPERPIPSGRVSATAAAVIAIVLLMTGVLAASRANRTAGMLAAAIAGCVVLYDTWGKHVPWVAPVNMGVCRSLNLLLGIAAVPSVLGAAWYLGFVPLLYIGAVTALSRGEVFGGNRRVAAGALISLLIVWIALLALALTGGGTPLAGLVLLAILAWRLFPAFWSAYKDGGPDVIRQAVRTGVLSLVLVDATIGATFAGPLYGLGILATVVVAGLLARLFLVT